MPNLKVLELHLNVADQWPNAGIDIIKSLCHKLERLFISEQLVGRQHLRLVEVVTRQSFGKEPFRPQALYLPGNDDKKMKYAILYNKGLAFLGYQFAAEGVCYRVIEAAEDNSLVHTENYRHKTEIANNKKKNRGRVVPDRGERDDESMAIDMEALDSVDEDEFQKSAPERFRVGVIDESRDNTQIGIELLRLNGRLLDRERNKHSIRDGNALVQCGPDDEVAVRVGERPARRFPVIVAAADRGHWMCDSEDTTTSRGVGDDDITTDAVPLTREVDAINIAPVPLAAQLPISKFSSLPEFPPEASHLRALTLTSDIPLPEYQSLVSGGEYSLPVLPQSITHLTLELFSLGFPGRNPRYLSNLAVALPNLKSVTAFACLLDGLDDASRTDAERFFDTARGLRELHLIDTFVRPGYWTAVGKLLEKRAREEKEIQEATGDAASNCNNGTAAGGTQVVEVSYTYRGHSDSDFLARLHGEEMPLLIVPGLVGAGFGLVEEAEGDKSLGETAEDGNDGSKPSPAGGILPFASDSRATAALKKRFANFKQGELASLKVLNLGMWTLTVEDIKEILLAISPSQGKEETGLIDLTISVLLTQDWLSELMKVLGDSPATKALEGLEIIGVPSLSKPGGSASGPAKSTNRLTISWILVMKPGVVSKEEQRSFRKKMRRSLAVGSRD
ncbi:uncharacterized protein AB675_8833 [Cyphellophora attinorum]|uniref:Uncharacterized protein n=1 Tax=Cyphellophora attinorum TaxID=1664694 RepID=A0A0N1H9H3_9EURO|nr:uncharacterized protein AB675_8833 [Phialophora attinorum]KPI44277.1 hypothetical protein AB675_8833 [Phialophora attinorum]